jgi:hypothetical protein
MSETTVRSNSFEYDNVRPVYNKPLGNSYTYDYQAKPGSAIVTYKNIHRIPHVAYPLPSFDVKVPGRWQQWVNIAALSANHRSAVTALKS